MARSILTTGLPIAVVLVLLANGGAALHKRAVQAKAQPAQTQSKALFNLGGLLGGSTGGILGANAGGSVRPLLSNLGVNAGAGVSFQPPNGIGQSLGTLGAGAGRLANVASNILLKPLTLLGSGITSIRPGQSPPYYPNQQTTSNVGMVGWGSYGSNTGTITYNQCNSLWKDALLKEAINYDDWRCSVRLNPDGPTSSCVLTGAIGTSVTPTVVTTGCGWTMPLFCDDSVNDIVYSLRATTPTATPATPVGYTYVAGVGTYKVHPESLTWAAAKAACEAEGAHLAVPSTSTDYSTILNQLNSAIPLHNGAWVGLSDIALEGYFQTVTGQPLCTLGQAVFNTGEPNNGEVAGIASPVENCIEFGLARAAVLNDVPCTTILPFVCEITLPSRLAPCKA